MNGLLAADDSQLTYQVDVVDSALDVVFDGHRVWSLDPREHQPQSDGTRNVAWPSALASRLDGVATVELRVHGTEHALVSARCTFGDGQGPVDLTDDNGRLLSLSKWGRMNQSFADLEPELLAWYLDRAEDVLRLLSDEAGVPAFLAYGSLLGAARSGRFIGHDMDVDLAYLSAAQTPADAMLESFAIERLARAHGWWVQRQNGGFLQVFFLQPGGGWRNVDIFTMFVEPSVGRLYGLNDTATPADRDAVVPLSSISLEGRPFPAPAKVDVFMQAAYGPTWRVPDPNFSYGMTPGKRQMKDWFSGYRADRDRWTRVYRYQPEIVPREPTQFAHWAREQVGDVDTVVDVGCGMGRDTFLYASSLPQAVGLDAAGSGVRRATRRGHRSGSAAEFRQVNLCSLRGTAVAGALLARDYPGPRAVTANHLLDAVSPTGVPHFWALCAMLLRGGGRLVTEFSADERDGEFVQFPGLTRRVVRPEQVADSAADRGGSVRDARRTVTEEGESWQMVIEWP